MGRVNKLRGIPQRTTLTARDKQVVKLISTGASNKEIAFQLGLTYSTVKFYVSTIMGILHIENRTKLALWWLEQAQTAPVTK